MATTLDVLSRPCLQCGATKPLTEFHRHPTGPHGRRSRCKQCQCALRRSYYDPVSARLYAAKYKASADSRPEVFESRTCVACGLAFQFYRPLEQSRAGQGKFCSKKCKDSIGATSYACERCGRAFDGWKCRPRRFCSVPCARRSSPARRVIGYASAEWRALRRKVLERDGYECQRCRTPFSLVAHHLIPRAFGGRDIVDNLVTVCRSCHAAVHALAVNPSLVPVGGVS